jgi:DNA-binding response OmpR family regulator
MLTGSDTPVHGTSNWIDLGAEMVIEKPIRPRDLVAKLATLLRGGAAGGRRADGARPGGRVGHFGMVATRRSLT